MESNKPRITIVGTEAETGTYQPYKSKTRRAHILTRELPRTAAS